MKTSILISIFLFCSILSFAQTSSEWGIPYNEEKKLIIYEEVVPVEGVNKAELYNRAIDWINTYYTAGANKITEKDVNTGIIKVKDRIIFYKMEKKTKVNDVIIDYNLEILLKDNKFKVTIQNFRAFQGSTSPPIEKWMNPNEIDPEIAKTRYANLNTEMTKMIENMKSSIITGPKKPDQDW